MAMTKAERAQFEQLETELSFRWPTEAEPERMPKPSPMQREDREGWSFNAFNQSVQRAWSTSTGHGYFYEGRRSSGSRGAVSLYETEADALLALRWALCRQYARTLREVDKRLLATRTPTHKDDQS